MLDSSLSIFNLTIAEAEPLFKKWIAEVLKENSNSRPDSPAKDLPNYLTRSDVANVLNISLPTVDRYIDIGLLKARRVGSRVLFDADEIKQALSEIPVKFSLR